MRRFLLWSLLIVTCIGALIWAAAQDAGYVLISYLNVRYESSLWAALVVVALLCLAVYLVRLLQRALFASVGAVNPWSRRRQRRRTLQAARQGQLDLVEGRWKDALRHLRRAAQDETQPLPHLLGAARAANELGEVELRDDFLSQALACEPKALIAIGLSRSRMLIDRGDFVEARAELESLQHEEGRQVEVLRLLQQLYVQQQAWPALCRLLPDLRKHRVLNLADMDRLERGAWLELLNATVQEAGHLSLDDLHSIWKRIPANLHRDPELLTAYSQRLQEVGHDEEAVKLLSSTISDTYDDRLVHRYGLLRSSDPARQLKRAEEWLQARPSDALLLLTLGRLSLANQLWGKARDYLEASLSINPNVEACSELARLLAHLGEGERSNALYREGLALLNREQVQLPPAGSL